MARPVRKKAKPRTMRVWVHQNFGSRLTHWGYDKLSNVSPECRPFMVLATLTIDPPKQPPEKIK